MIVDLPAPDGPTRAVVLRAGNRSDTSSMANRSSAWYLNETRSKEMSCVMPANGIVPDVAGRASSAAVSNEVTASMDAAAVRRLTLAPSRAAIFGWAR